MENIERKKELLREQFEARPLRHRIESSSHLQRQAKRIWNHLRRDAQEQLATEVLWVELEARTKREQARKALDNIFEYEALISELDPEEPTPAEELLQRLPEEAQGRGESALEALRKNPIFKGEVSAVVGSEGSGTAEIEPLRGEEFAILDYERVLVREVVHQGIRHRTARAMVVMLDRNRRIPELRDGEWLHWISNLENHFASTESHVEAETKDAEAKGRTDYSREGLLQTYEQVLRGLQETLLDGLDERAMEARVMEVIRPLIEKDLKRIVGQGLTMRARLKEDYQRNREADQYHSRSEDDLVRARERLGHIREALRLLRRFEELYPEWEARARLVRERLRENPVGVNLVPHIPQKADEHKSRLFEERNELNVQLAVQTMLPEGPEMSEVLPEWEEAKKQIFDGERSEVDLEDINHRRCRALARLNPREFSTWKEMSEAVAKMIENLRTNGATLSHSLRQLELESGEMVFFTVGNHTSDKERQKERRKRVERSRQWCKENGVPQ